MANKKGNQNSNCSRWVTRRQHTQAEIQKEEDTQHAATKKNTRNTQAGAGAGRGGGADAEKEEEAAAAAPARAQCSNSECPLALSRQVNERIPGVP